MNGYRCQSCGKAFDPEKTEICPACGAAAAPSVMTRIERKRTAVRLRAEGMLHYDDHCHDDDAWKGSYGAQAHRSAVQAHEANIRANYRAHDAADVTTRDAKPAPRSKKQENKLAKLLQTRPILIALLFFLIPLICILLGSILSAVIRLVESLADSFGGSFGSFFP
jgi:hypothetical protein